MTEDELQALRSGDVDSWDRFIKSEAAPRIRFACMEFYHIPNMDIDDVQQDVLVRLWAHRDSLFAESLKGWMGTVARRIIIDALRKRVSSVPIQDLEQSVDEAFSKELLIAELVDR